MMIENFTIPIIGVHHSPLTQKFGIPRQPNLVNIPTKIEMFAPYNDPLAFVGIEEFSHLWISWQFHHNKPQANFRPQVRPPRLGGNKKLGIFATRSMYRPSALGLSVVQLEKVDIIDNQVYLHIIGADFVDGTPIIDIKPYIAYSDAISDANSGFAPEPPTQKMVTINEQAQHDCANTDLTDDDLNYICQLIAQDPRPAYRQTEVDKQCIMRYGNFDIGFIMNTDNQLIINQIIRL